MHLSSEGCSHEEVERCLKGTSAWDRTRLSCLECHDLTRPSRAFWTFCRKLGSWQTGVCLWASHPQLLVRSFDVKMSSISLVSSSTRSSVFETKHSWSPDCLRSICTPRTLHNESKAISFCLDILQPNSKNIVSTQKSTCLDSLRRARHKKPSKYADHKSRSRDVPIFHVASETLRKAVADAIDPNGKTLCLNIFADSEFGSHTARY